MDQKDHLKDFEQIIDKYLDKLVNHAFFRIGSLENAQDLVQNVFTKFFEKNIRFKNIKNPKSFLFKSVSNACVDYLRTKKLHIISLESVSEIRNISHSNHHELIEEYRRIDALLKGLPDNQAEIIRLRVIDEMSFKEIAEITGVSVSTIKSRFKYGIDKLKEKMKTKQEVKK